MWVLVGAHPTGPTSNGQPDVEDLVAAIMGKELSAPPELGLFLTCHCYTSSTRGTKENPPWQQAVIDFQHGLSLKNPASI
jgi:hypothetical protein